MDMKEKLEVIAHFGDHITYKEDIGICYDSALAKVIEDAYMTLKNGVTVQEGKPLEAFLHPIDAYKGLKAKYLVFKADTGEKVDNCFVLRPDKDPVAVEAIRAYASATDNETLAEDIYNWVGKGGPVQDATDNNVGRKWISVKDRLPTIYDADADNCVLAIHKASNKRYYHWRSVADNPFDFTHWMRTPQPPKGE